VWEVLLIGHRYGPSFGLDGRPYTTAGFTLKRRWRSRPQRALRVPTDNLGSRIRYNGSIVTRNWQRGKAFEHLNKIVRIRSNLLRNPLIALRVSPATAAAGFSRRKTWSPYLAGLSQTGRCVIEAYARLRNTVSGITTHTRTFRRPSAPPNFSHSFIRLDGSTRRLIRCLNGLKGGHSGRSASGEADD